MSALTATTSGLFDASQSASSARGASSVPSRPDESFWQGVFDRAETLGLATADADLATDTPGLGEGPAQAGAHHGEPEGAGPQGQARMATQTSSADTAPTTAWPSATHDIAKPLATAPWAPVLHSPHAARWQAARSYGLAHAEPIAPPPSTPATQAPAAVNATLVTLPDGQLKLYLRAAGLSAEQAIEAAALADLPWPAGQAPDIAEVVLNGQTIYTRGVDATPSFILTC